MVVCMRVRMSQVSRCGGLHDGEDESGEQVW